MKKTILLLLILAASAWSQTAPSGYTPNYSIRKWASGANPGADSLNANWTLIDTKIRQPGYTIQDSIISTGTALKLGSSDGTDTVFVGATSTPYAAGAKVYIGGVMASSGGLYAGIPSATSGAVRLYSSSNAHTATLTHAGMTNGPVTFNLPTMTAGTYTIALTDGSQPFSDSLTIKDVGANDDGRITFQNLAGTNKGTIIVPVDAGTVTWSFPDATGTVALSSGGSVFTGGFNGDASISDTSAFSGTNTRLAIYISGATSTDKYVVSPRIVAGTGAETLPTSNDVLGAAAKADSLIVLRPASGTSGLKVQYIRIR